MKNEKFLTMIIDELLGESAFTYSYPKLTLYELQQAGLEEEIRRVYEQLGGVCNQFPINYSWDIKCHDFILELDEVLHFNRYRLITLNSSIYQDYPFFNVENYKSYCHLYEAACLKAGSWGGRWKSDSTERFFLPSAPNGDLEGNGSSRWKQRAFNDYLKDLNSVVRGKKIIRISIYDEFQEERLGYMLEKQDRSKLKRYLFNLFSQYEIR